MSRAGSLTRRRFSGLFAAYLSSIAGVRSAGGISLQPPLALAVDASSLKVRAGLVIELLERHVETGYLVGAVALIGHGARAEVVAVGEQSIDAPRLMQRDSLFRITSMTAPITAAATLMLVDAGKLHLAEPIDYWLPELAHRRVLRHPSGPLEDTVRARRSITVEDLLSSRCGLGIVPATAEDSPMQRRIADLRLSGFGPPDPASPLSPDEWLHRLGTLPLVAQPGETWLESTSASILGILISRVAHKPLPVVLAERIFAPLGMRDTAFVVPASKRERLVSAYHLEAGRLQLEDDPARSPWLSAPAFPDGSAGLVSTLDDYFAFSYFLLTQGHTARAHLLSASAVIDMTRDHLTPAQHAAAPAIGDRRGWGLGLGVVTETTPQGIPAGAYGSTGRFGTSWVADPLSATSAILLTQTLLNSPMPPAVHQEFWSAVFSPPVV
jgi:CubicO group peptidase (beta-lactamase class C family)